MGTFFAIKVLGLLSKSSSALPLGHLSYLLRGKWHGHPIDRSAFCILTSIAHLRLPVQEVKEMQGRSLGWEDPPDNAELKHRFCSQTT